MISIWLLYFRFYFKSLFWETIWIIHHRKHSSQLRQWIRIVNENKTFKWLTKHSNSVHHLSLSMCFLHCWITLTRQKWWMALSKSFVQDNSTLTLRTERDQLLLSLTVNLLRYVKKLSAVDLPAESTTSLKHLPWPWPCHSMKLTVKTEQKQHRSIQEMGLFFSSSKSCSLSLF